MYDVLSRQSASGRGLHNGKVCVSPSAGIMHRFALSNCAVIQVVEPIRAASRAVDPHVYTGFSKQTPEPIYNLGHPDQYGAEVLAGLTHLIDH